MTLAVHMPTSFDDDWIIEFKSLLDDTIALSHGDQLPEPSEYEILIAGVPEREYITASPNLKVLIIPWSGLPVATRELMLEYSHIGVYNIHHNAAAAAETAVTLMMAAAKRTLAFDKALRKGDWRPRYDFDASVPDGPLLLAGKTALILGYGAIGSKIASICRGMGMKTMVVKADIPQFSDGDIEIYTVKALKNLLPRTNVLFICLPMTPETKGLIGRKELALLPDQSIVVNIARGPVIDERALYEALSETDKQGRHRLRAGLDVWYKYPGKEEDRNNTAPSEFPFQELDNVVMTPHLGGHSDRTEAIRREQLAELLNAIAREGKLPRPVDIERGY